MKADDNKLKRCSTELLFALQKMSWAIGFNICFVVAEEIPEHGLGTVSEMICVSLFGQVAIQRLTVHSMQKQTV